MVEALRVRTRWLGRSERRLSDRWGPALLVGPTVLVLAALVIYPLVYVIYVSFHRWFLFEESHPSVGVDNYERFLTGEDHQLFWNAVKLMFVYAGVALGAELVLGFLLAALFYTKMRGVEIFRTLFVIPILIAPIVVGQIWRFMLEPSYGVINYVLSLVGITGPAWVSDPDVAIYTIIMVDVWQWTPFVFLILLAGLHAMPGSIEDAAELDGARFVKKSIFVTIPLLKRVILVIILLRGIDLLRSFDLVYALTLGGPGNSSNTLPFFTWNQGFKLFELGRASALGIMVVLIINVVVFFVIKFFRGGFETR
jgi:multiple sugar transport system permease protein